ncbi:MAG: type II toxin-antitoxin system VapC family toxin [Candidatus Binatia bacterium]
MAILLYLDTNVFCRPFDDQTVGRIQRETEAFTLILEKIAENEAAFGTSDLLLFEIRRILSPAKRAKAMGYLPLSRDHHRLDDDSLQLAREIMTRFKIKPRDSLHLASALLMEAQYFLSCDDAVTKRFRYRPLSAIINTIIGSIRVMNPVELVRTMHW